jgi:hypothetical protein
MMIMMCVDVQNVYEVFLKRGVIGKRVGAHHIGF